MRGTVKYGKRPSRCRSLPSGRWFNNSRTRQAWLAARAAAAAVGIANADSLPNISGKLVGDPSAPCVGYLWFDSSLA